LESLVKDNITTYTYVKDLNENLRLLKLENEDLKNDIANKIFFDSPVKKEKQN
jgi:hypothetical protein